MNQPGGGLAEPLAVGAFGSVTLALVNPPDAGAPWCPSVLLFSTPCPLCGLTRGVARFVRGDFAASLEFHPLAWLLLLFAAAAWVAWLGRRANWWQWRSPRLEKAVIVSVVLALALTWALRAMTGTLPPVTG